MPDYRRAARQAAQRHGLNPGIFERQIAAESGFNPSARSPAGAVGIAQIMPATARGWGVDPRDPIASLNAAAANMARYVKQFGNYADALRAYNAGPGNVRASRGFGETNAYVRKILSGSSAGATGRESAGVTPTAGSRETVTTTIPGVDNRVARAQLIQSFLEDANADPVSFAVQARALRDIPEQTRSQTITVPGVTGRLASGAQSALAAGGGSTSEFGARHSKLLELIFNTGGQGFAVKDGQKVDGPQFYSGVWDGHRDHVHVAAGRKTVVALGRLAEQMGLHVGENPTFGGVDPVHVPGSYHYKGEAIDVSGDKAKMAQFASRVERLYGIR